MSDHVDEIGGPVQIGPLELVFNHSHILVEEGQAPDGAPMKKLILIHPCGIAAIALLPEQLAKDVGGRLMGSGKIVTATQMPPPPQ